MRRYTTPTHQFALPFKAEDVAALRLTYVQDNKIVLEKTKADLKTDGNLWSITLTQEESALFSVGYASAQIRVVTTNGKALASGVMTLRVGGVFHEGVLP